MPRASRAVGWDERSAAIRFRASALWTALAHLGQSRATIQACLERPRRISPLARGALVLEGVVLVTGPAASTDLGQTLAQTGMPRRAPRSLLSKGIG